MQALRALGLDVVATKLGSALMSAAQQGQVAGVVIAAETDDELRELFMRAFKSRHPAVPVVCLSTRPDDEAVRGLLVSEGASAVLPWPLPPPSLVLPTLAALVPLLVAERRQEAGFSPVIPEAEADVLGRKLVALEEEGLGGPPVVRAEAFEAAVRQVVEQRAENTELRSELTVFRDRNRVLEDRIDRLRAEVESLTRERDSLLHDEPSVPSSAYQELMGGVESYSWAMEGAVEFLEDLKVRVGNRAPSLDVHLRTVKLVKQLLDRLGQEAKGGGSR